MLQLFFPQVYWFLFVVFNLEVKIDDEFLVISDGKKVNVQELQDILVTKIEEGFTFPINPKGFATINSIFILTRIVICFFIIDIVLFITIFSLKRVLCDPGWRNVYNALLASKKGNVQDSINCWLQPGTRLREDIDAMSARHPLGFEATNETTVGKESMAEILDDFERYLKIQRAWRKLRLCYFGFDS